MQISYNSSTGKIVSDDGTGCTTTASNEEVFISQISGSGIQSLPASSSPSSIAPSRMPDEDQLEDG